MSEPELEPVPDNSEEPADAATRSAPTDLWSDVAAAAVSAMPDMTKFQSLLSQAMPNIARLLPSHIDQLGPMVARLQESATPALLADAGIGKMLEAQKSLYSSWKFDAAGRNQDYLASLAPSLTRLQEAASVALRTQPGLSDTLNTNKALLPLLTAMSAGAEFDRLRDIVSFVDIWRPSASRPSDRLARQVADALRAPSDPQRRPRLVDRAAIVELIEDATRGGDDVAIGEALESAGFEVVREPLPLAEDGLLEDDDEQLTAWVSQLVHGVMDSLGLSERDLLEDTVATLAYGATMALAITLLLQFPFALAIAGMTGVGANVPAAFVSKLARRGFRLMNQL